MNDPFEQQLGRTPFRTVPGDWRADIIEAARTRLVQPEGTATARISRLSWLDRWLWPSPKAWAGLAAVWILIFGFQMISRPKTADTHSVSTSLSPAATAVLDQQRQLQAELIGYSDSGASVEERYVPGPRSARDLHRNRA